MNLKTTLRVKIPSLPIFIGFLIPAVGGLYVLALTASQNIGTSLNFRDLVMNCIICLAKPFFYRMTVLF